MRKSSWIVLGLIVVLCGLAIYMTIASAPPSDEEQIHVLLSNAQSAVERRSTPDALACIAHDYQGPVRQ